MSATVNTDAVADAAVMKLSDGNSEYPSSVTADNTISGEVSITSQTSDGGNVSRDAHIEVR